MKTKTTTSWTTRRVAASIAISVSLAAGGAWAEEVSRDIVIYGSSSAAISAAVQAKRMGRSAVVVSPETRIGGLTTGGLGQTDIGNKNAFGGIALEFYRDVAKWYADPAHWKQQDMKGYRPDGQCSGTKGESSMWTFEPSAALAILEGWEKRDALEIRRNEWLDRAKGVEKKDGRIVSIKTLSGNVYRGKMFIDATYEGDLLAAAGVPYVVGREANSVYGETISGIEFREAKYHQFKQGVSPYVVEDDPASGLLPGIEPYNPDEKNGDGDKRVQAYNFRMCLTDDPENRIPFAKPENYDEKEYELLFRNFAKGETAVPWINSKMPNRKTDTNNSRGFSTDFIGRNYEWPEASYERRAEIFKQHLDYQRGLMWTLANHERVPEKIRAVVSKWGTCKDEFLDGPGDGWQSQLYVREARRMVGDYVMTEHECRGDRIVPHPVAMGAYTMDSHHSRRVVTAKGTVQNEGDVQDHGRYSAWGPDASKRRRGLNIKPYGIDYGSITPKRSDCENLLVPVCLSASHMAFGSIRMEPVFFALGQVAGTAASMAVAKDAAVQDVPYAELSERLLADGQVIGLEKSAPALIPAPREMTLSKETCASTAEPKVERVDGIPAEGYELSIKPDGVTIRAGDAAGEFYARQTLAQLKDGTTFPCCEIKDSPRFKWRGVHVDDVRHFIGKAQAKRTIDQIAKYKFNVFHWHLTDNEAWRIEVPGYPKLTEKGAFYTKDDIREVVAYAAERHIKVVPEVDFPGHFRKLSNVYPELSCTTDDPSEKGRAPMCVGNPDAVKFVEAALDAVCDLFPESDIIHIGGDECAQVIWTKCEKCKAMMAREGIEKPHDLQAWITLHAVKHLAAKGRRAIGWDEMLDAKEGYLPTSAMGMRWHDKGAERTARAAAVGHEIVNCHKRFCYFDYPQGLEGDKLRYFGRGRPHEIVTIEKVYSFDPLAELPVESHSKVIGGQCNNWSERTYNGKNLEWKLWPRALALSEVLWTYPDPKKRDFEGFKRRAEVRREALVASGVNAAPLPTAEMLAMSGQASVNWKWKGGSGGSKAKPLDLYNASNWSDDKLPSKSEYYMLAVDAPTVLTNSAPADAIIADWFSPYSGDFTFLGALRVQVFGWVSPCGRATIVKEGDWTVGYEFDLAHESKSYLAVTNVSGNVTKISGDTALRIGAGANSTAIVENLAGDWILSGNVVLGHGAGSRGEFTLGGGSLTAKTVSAKDGAGTLVFNGGTLRARNDGTLIANSANLTVTVGEKGGVIDTNGKHVTIEKEVVGTGKLLIIGGGTVKFTTEPKCKVETVH